MDSDPRDPLTLRQAGEGHQVAVVGVHPARPDEAHGVQHPVRLASTLAGGEERRPVIERTVGDRGVDARQVLEHRTACTEVQMADLRVAHLARR